MKRFWNFVQLPAKVACLFPFLLALLYAAGTYRRVSARDTLLFFISMLAFDLSVTGLNSTIDTRSNGLPLPFSRRTAKQILAGLWIIAGAAAVPLVADTGPIVLATGAACFFVGIFYTFGPAPISHLPLGELFSGLFEGFFIPFLVVFINSPGKSLLDYSLRDGMLAVVFNLPGLFRLALLCLPGMLCIANIMLANNICDLEADVKVNRFTLPHFIGTRRALRLFALLYGLAYAGVIGIAVFRVLPAYVLAALLPCFWVGRNIAAFRRRQSKAVTFPLSVRNFLLIMAPLAAAAAVAVF